MVKESYKKIHRRGCFVSELGQKIFPRRGFYKIQRNLKFWKPKPEFPLYLKNHSWYGKVLRRILNFFKVYSSYLTKHFLRNNKLKINRKSQPAQSY